MTHPFTRSVIKLEGQARARDLPTWAEVDAAMEPLFGHAVATLATVLHGQARQHTMQRRPWLMRHFMSTGVAPMGHTKTRKTLLPN
jgi:hypothetical protein